MTNKKITVSLPKACEVNLEEMQTVANGKFCTHCSKTVWDFRDWSEEELGHFFANTEQLVCGRFAALQLDSPLPVPSQNHYGKIAAAALGFSLFLAQDALAQHKTPLKPKQNIVALQKIQSHKMIGLVQDDESNKVASIAIQLLLNDSLIVQVYTDRMGCFELAIPNELLRDKALKISIQSNRYSPYQRALSDFDWQQSNMITVYLVSPKIIRTVERVEHTAGVPVRHIENIVPLVKPLNSNKKVNKTYDSKEIERRGIDNILKDVH